MRTRELSTNSRRCLQLVATILLWETATGVLVQATETTNSHLYLRCTANGRFTKDNSHPERAGAPAPSGIENYYDVDIESGTFIAKGISGAPKKAIINPSPTPSVMWRIARVPFSWVSGRRRALTGSSQYFRLIEQTERIRAMQMHS